MITVRPMTTPSVTPPGRGVPRPGRLGFTEPGGGRFSYVDAPVEYRGTTVQVCGLYPFGTGSATPTVGVPLGRHRYTGNTVCFDPVSWFTRTNLINTPSVYILGEPGMGKALDVDTLIPTPTGTARMGDLQPGDAVFDENGRPTTVVATSGVMTDRECFAVRFSDGAEIIADAQHLWVTETQPQRQRLQARRHRPPKDKSVGTLAEQQQVAALLRDARPGQTTTLREVAQQLGWHAGGRRARLYTWGGQVPMLAIGPNRRHIYDRVELLRQIAMALAEPWRPLKDFTSSPVTTTQLRDTLVFAGKANHAIPVVGIGGAESDLPLPPRLLGLWLGDGTTHSAGFTTADAELAAEFAAAGFAVHYVGKYHYSIAAVRPTPQQRRTTCELCGSPIFSPRRGQRMCSKRRASQSRRAGLAPPPQRCCSDCGIALAKKAMGDQCRDCASAATLVGRLRAIGVLGDKHIPASYLRSSVRQRRELLSGLLDTDGTVSPTGQIQFTNVNRRLATDVCELIASLGYRPAMVEKPAVLHGRRVGTSWQIGFTTDEAVFGLPRKRAMQAQRASNKSAARTRLRYIVGVEPVPSRPVRCIQVANPSGMYLASRSFVATHNSTCVRRMVLGLTAQGVTPLILGDLKPDYAQLVAALGGQVLRVGPGLDRINPLDAGPWRQAMSKVDRKVADQVRAAIVDRRVNMVTALMTLIRRSPVTADEATVIAAAVRYLSRRETGTQPVLRDLLEVIREAPDEVRAVTLFTGDDGRARFAADTEALQRTLLALLHGPLSDLFAGPTSTPIDLDTSAVCVDISGIDETDELRTAATLLSTWSYGFGQITAAHLLADLGLAPARTYFTVLDEMWRALRTGHGLVDRADGLTRLNRQQGTGVAMITHSLADLEALPTEHDRAKARGFAERCAVLMVGACSQSELDAVDRVRRLSQAERAEVLSWSAPPSLSAGRSHVPVGLGNFLLKVGSRPGVPLHLQPTAAERQLGNTNTRWVMGPGVDR